MENMDDAVAALNAALKGSTDEVELAMGRVKGYLRHLKGGKTVQVKGHDRHFEAGRPAGMSRREVRKADRTLAQIRAESARMDFDGEDDSYEATEARKAAAAKRIGAMADRARKIRSDIEKVKSDPQSVADVLHNRAKALWKSDSKDDRDLGDMLYRHSVDIKKDVKQQEFLKKPVTPEALAWAAFDSQRMSTYDSEDAQYVSDLNRAIAAERAGKGTPEQRAMIHRAADAAEESGVAGSEIPKFQRLLADMRGAPSPAPMSMSEQADRQSLPADLRDAPIVARGKGEWLMTTSSGHYVAVRWSEGEPDIWRFPDTEPLPDKYEKMLAQSQEKTLLSPDDYNDFDAQSDPNYNARMADGDYSEMSDSFFKFSPRDIAQLRKVAESRPWVTAVLEKYLAGTATRGEKERLMWQLDGTAGLPVFMSNIDSAEEAMLVELAGLIDVKSYFRRTKSGKTVNVKSYKRKVLGSDLKPGDIVKDTFGKQQTVSSVAPDKVTFTSGKTASPKASFEKQDAPSALMTGEFGKQTAPATNKFDAEHDKLAKELVSLEDAASSGDYKAQKRQADLENQMIANRQAKQKAEGTSNPTADRAFQGRKSSGYDAARVERAGNPGAKGAAIPKVEKARDAKVEPLTDEEYQAHTQKIEEEIGRALKEGKATDKQFAVDANSGVWEFERAQRHREIADAMWKARAEQVPNEGKAMISGGLGGAGKSTVLKTVPGADEGNYFTINSDDVKEHIAENFPDMIPEAGDLSPLERVALIHEESSHIADLLAARAYAEKKNMIWDITMASQKSVQKRIDDLRANGYTDVQGIFVNIDVETSVSRALARHRRGMEDFRNGKGKGGRYVPPAIIRLNKSDKSSSANLDTFTALRDQFNSWHQYNNNVTGRAPVKEGSGSGSAASSVAADPFVNRTNL